jgi:hypothetical protein
MYAELGERFEEKLLSVATRYVNSHWDYEESTDPITLSVDKMTYPNGSTITEPFILMMDCYIQTSRLVTCTATANDQSLTVAPGLVNHQ